MADEKHAEEKQAAEKQAENVQSKAAYTPKIAWSVYKDQETRDKVRSFCDDYIAFLSACKTERETVAKSLEVLQGQGYSNDPASDRYVTTLNGKCLFAFKKGKAPLKNGVRLIIAHTDCPRLDFRPHPFVEQAGYAQAKTHYYGGLLKYQWLARPLALHGVIVKETGETVQICLGEKKGEPVFTIEDLLPHLAKKLPTQTVREAFEAEKLNVILGAKPLDTDEETKVSEPVKTAILDLLLETCNVREEDFISAEIQVVPAGEASYVGLDSSLVGSYGQDDRICVYTALRALTDMNPELDNENCVLILSDREEIGSEGSTGASSRFFEYCLADVVQAHEPETALRHVILASYALSADVTAGLDPDFQDAHEKNNCGRLGYGVCFEKYTGSGGKYGASEAHAEFFAMLRGLMNRRGIPWQATELGKVDCGGGGTVALFLAAWGMNVIDCGPALLCMHSPFELSSVVDIYAAWQAYMAFYEG